MFGERQRVAMVRTALFEAAYIMLTPAMRFPSQKRWVSNGAQKGPLIGVEEAPPIWI